MKDSSHSNPVKKPFPKRYPRPAIQVAIVGSILLLLYIFVIKGSTTTATTSKSSSGVKSRLIVSEASYQSYVKKRKALVGSNVSGIIPWPVQGKDVYFWDYFLPTFNCPHGIDRIGSLGDGGKYVCGLELFNKTGLKQEPCVAYSFGVAKESSYEAELLEKTNCDIYAYDASVNGMGPQIPPGFNQRIHFNKMFVGAKDTENKKTLGSIMRQNGHTWIDFLKMDIEGGELDLLNQVMDEFIDVLPFGQMQIEVHGDRVGKTFPKIYKLWERMEERGLRAFKNEVNYWPCVAKHANPNLIEYSFLNLRGEHRLITN